MPGVKQVIFKPRKVQSEYCTVCETFLTGNGSLAEGWECQCGKYEFSWEDSRYLHPTETNKSLENGEKDE